MICKSCGHNNYSTALKCASCGTIIDNERLQMFAAQSQSSKGMDVSLSQVAPTTSDANEGFGAGGFPGGGGAGFGAPGTDDFFSELQAPAPSTPVAAKPAFVPKEAPKQTFFQETKEVGEPSFETEIEDLHPELRPKGPAEHPLYSPPANPLIDEYIARRSAARKS